MDEGIEAVDTLSRYEEAREDEKLCNQQVDLSLLVAKYVQHKVILLSDLPEDLVAEIFSRIHITSLRSVRSTCKKWNILSRSLVLGQVSEAKNQFLGFLMMDFRIFTLRIALQELRYDFSNLYVKKVSGLNQIKLSKAYHCDGLLLCVLHDKSELLVWNPYLGQRRWILQPRDILHASKRFALGYDNNRNHKILEIILLPKGIHYSVIGFNIYEFSSNSWKSIDITPNWDMRRSVNHVTLKGNAYFVARDLEINMDNFLVSFDFTSERFGPRLSLPFYFHDVDVVVLSCVRDKQLAVLHQNWQKRELMEIWVTNKIDYNEVSWTKWTTVNTNMLARVHYDSFLGSSFSFDPFLGSIFIDEEKKITVLFGQNYNQNCSYHTAHIIGQAYEYVNVGRAADRERPNVIGYFPSLVQIE